MTDTQNRHSPLLDHAARKAAQQSYAEFNRRMDELEHRRRRNRILAIVLLIVATASYFGDSLISFFWAVSA